MNNFQNQHLNNHQPDKQNNQQAVNSHLPNQPNNQPSPLMQIVGAVLPSLIEHFTGQKMNPSNNSPENQLMLSQILMFQQQIVTGQQNLDQRLTQLEMSASQQFTGPAQEVKSIKSIRLTHDRERKQIEFNGNENFQQKQEN